MRHGRVAVSLTTLVVVVAGCGGGGGAPSIDVAALRARIVERSPSASADEIDATVEVVRRACERADAAAMAQLRSEDPRGYDLARIACPEQAATADGPRG